MDVNKKIESIIKKIVQVIAIIILLFLTIMSIIQTSYVDKTEITQYLSDNPIIHIISIMFVLCLIIFLRKKNIKLNKKMIWIFVGIWGIVSVAWIFMTQLYPRADQKYILNIANDMRKGILTGFDKPNYAFCNPHQIGLIMFEFLTGLIFRKYNFIGLQLLNIIAILIAFYSMYQITKMMFKDKETSIYTIITLFLFIPISLYITFIYGNLFGLATSMVAVWMLLKYLENKNIKYIIISAICIELAIIFKSNYLVTLIAMICLLVLYIISEKRIKTAIPIGILLISYILGSFLLNFATEFITKKEKNDGIPMTSYIAMGLQESERAPGWYNRYNRKTYEKSNYNSEIASAKIKKDINELINNFKENPKYAVEFFYKKTISQWNNPTFQSLWINKSRSSNIEKNALVKSVIGEGKVNKLLTAYMNVVQSLILFGATAYMFLDFKNMKSKQLIFIIIFIGGFLFHMIWEAKCQYTLTYFVLLIPYAVRGFLQLTNRLKKNS